MNYGEGQTTCEFRKVGLWMDLTESDNEGIW